jgi:hypothetical protein
MFRKLDLFQSSGAGWEAPTTLDILERANINHWTRLAPSKGPGRVGPSPPHLRTETDPVSETLVFPPSI